MQLARLPFYFLLVLISCPFQLRQHVPNSSGRWPDVKVEIAAPAVFDRRAQIPFTGLTVLDPFEKNHVVAPRQLSSKLLHN
jgi:hypothetical protein